MLTRTEIVWRHLLHEAEAGRRRHPSLAAFAEPLGLPVSTVHKALSLPGGIGAVAVRRAGGLRVLDPFRLAVLWAGRRRLDRDVIDTWATVVPAADAERRLALPGVVLGGHGAVVARLVRNTIADYSTVIVYADHPEPLRAVVPEAPDGTTTVVVARPDPLLHRYGSVTPLHQAWVDLFTRSDWAAARFVEALTSRWVHTDAA